MNLTTLLLQIVLTIPLTIILNYFKKKENRRINELLIPSIYIIVVAALLPVVKTNIFLIVIFEIFIRNFYVTNVVNQDKEISNAMFIIESIISIALSLFTYNYFISKVDTVIPDPETIKPFIWFLIIIFVAYLFKISTKDRVIKESKNQKKYKKEQIIIKYAKYKNMYSNIVKSKNTNINNLVYALMIHNDNHNPKITRTFKEYLGLVTKKETPYSIMQIPSFNKIKDEEGIELTITNFEKKLKNTKLNETSQIDKLLETYEPSEKEDILAYYEIIKEFQNK